MAVDRQPRNLNYQNYEPALREHFRNVASQFSSGTLLIDEATDAVNFLLQKFGIAYVVSGDEFEEVLLGVTSDIEVSEDTFVHAYMKILPFALAASEEQLVHQYMTFFDKFMRGRETSRILYATRVLRRAWKKNRQSGMPVVWPMPDERETAQKMSRFDRDGDGKLNRVEFVCAALSIGHGIDKAIDDKILSNCCTKEVHIPFEFEIALA